MISTNTLTLCSDDCVRRGKNSSNSGSTWTPASASASCLGQPRDLVVTVLPDVARDLSELRAALWFDLYALPEDAAEGL